MADATPPYTHDPDQYFDFLVDYLRHLVDVHGIDETPELWQSGRDRFDTLHAALHGRTSRLMTREEK